MVAQPAGRPVTTGSRPAQTPDHWRGDVLRDILSEAVSGFAQSPGHQYRCPPCKDTGAITTVIDQRRYTSPCACAESYRSRIPRPDWQSHTMAGLRDQPGPIEPQTLIDAASYARTGRGTLVITGPYANRLAVAIGNAITEAGRPQPCFFRAQTITNDLEINFRANYPRYTAYPALIIVSAPAFEAMREREAANFVELVDYRTDIGHTTVIATGYNQYPITHAHHLDTGYVQQHGSIPANMADAMTFETFQAHSDAIANVLNAAKKWAQSAPGWIYISGGTGTGKTHLTVAAAVQRRRLGDSVHFQTAAGLIDHLRAVSNQSHQMFQQALSRIIDVDCLAIDDLGTARETPFAQEQLYKILNARYERRRPTIINSNHSPQRLAQDDHRIGSRLRDQNLVEHHHIHAPDYRVHGDSVEPIPEP